MATRPACGQRVLFLTYHLPLANEPGAFRPWISAKLLAELGFRVTVVTSGVQYMTGEDIRPSGGWCTEETIEGVRILRTWAPSSFRKSLRRRLVNYASFALFATIAALKRAGPAQYVFAGTDPILLTPVVNVVSRLKRASVILDERDLYPETAIALGLLREDGLLARCLRNMQRRARRRAKAIVAATPGISRTLISEGVPGSKVHLLYNADPFLHDQPVAQPSSPSLHEDLSASCVVAYAGGLGRANDVSTLLRAAERLRDVPGLHFIIIGAGENLPLYRRWCAERGMTNVRFMGALPRHKARTLLGQADVCVQPLLAGPHFQNTLTSKTFDYLALGRPVVASAAGDTARLLRESGGGIAVPPEDAEALAAEIRRLADDPVLRTALGAAGRDWFDANIGVDAARATLRRAFAPSVSRSREYHGY